MNNKRDKKPKLTQTQKMFLGSLRPCWAHLWKWDFRKVVALVLLLDQLLCYCCCCCYWWCWKCSQAGSLLQESLLSPSSAGGLWFFFVFLSLSVKAKSLNLNREEGTVVFILDTNLENFWKGEIEKTNPQKERGCVMCFVCVCFCVYVTEKVNRRNK